MSVVPPFRWSNGRFEHRSEMSIIIRIKEQEKAPILHYYYRFGPLSYKTDKCFIACCQVKACKEDGMMEKLQEGINRIINGVDVERLDELKNSFNDDPDLASLRFIATNEWVNGANNRTIINGLYQNGKDIVRETPFILESDEPSVLLGADAAPNAIVSLLHALASSLSVSIVYHAAMREMTIDKLTISLEGDVDVHGFLGLSQEVRPGFQDLRVKVSVESSASTEEVNDLVRYAQSVSPILDSLRNRIPLDVEMA